ncbi:MAG: FAD-dependent oxidoreductase [Bacteroidota bacterium]
MAKRHIIIGGSDAGISAALRIKEISPEDQVQMFLADAYPNFSICGIPFYFSREVSDWKTLAHRTADDIQKQGIDIFPNHFVSHIDPDQKEIQANGHTYAYDELLIGTGAKSIKPPLPGMDEEGVFTLRWIGEMLEIDQFITQKQVKKALIVGGGYIGIEMADSLRVRGLEVDLVEFQSTILQTLDEGFGKAAQQKLEEQGVKVFTGTAVEKIAPSESGLFVSGSHGFQSTCQLVLVVVGARPNSSLAMEAGVQVNARQTIKTDFQMRTNISSIYAAGDCVETYHSLLKQHVYLPLGTTAHKQGRIAGSNMAGQKATFKGAIGSQVLKIFNMVAGRTGIHDRDAAKYHLPSFTSESEFWDHKVYYPGANKLYIRLTGNPESGKLLGAQIIGSTKSEVAKRIDILATAIQNEYAVDQLNDLDLTYTPPLSSPWDPVQMAAQEWLKNVGK